MQTFLIQNFDVAFDTTGHVKEISGITKARQDISEMLSIEIQDDGNGSGLPSLVGDANQTDDGISSNLQFSMRDAITQGTQRLMDLQRQTLTGRTLDELIVAVVGVQVDQDRVDPTFYRWRAGFQTQAGQILTLNGRVT